MLCLLRVVRFDVGYLPKAFCPLLGQPFPHIRRVLALRVARRLAFVWPLIVPFAGVLGRDADRIEIERVVGILAEPQDRLIAPGETFARMQAMLKVPDDAIAKLQP